MATCSAEVTDGNGRFAAVASATPSAASGLRKQALQAACERMCGYRKEAKPKACAARCVVDVGAGKMGGRMSCSKPAASGAAK